MISRLKTVIGAAHRFISGLSGWRRYAFACAAGTIAAFSMAPYYFLPLLIVGFSSLVWLLDRVSRHPKKTKVSFWTGWWFAFGYLYMSIYWLAFSFFHYAESTLHFVMLGVLGFVGVAAAAGFIALFYGAATAAAARFWRDDWTRGLVLIFVWSLAEYTRGHVLTGFPWNLTGQAFAGLPILAQSTALVGPYGLSLIVLLLAVLPALCLSGREERGELSAIPLWSFGAIMAALLFYGGIRLAANPVLYTDNIQLQVIQPNISQRDKIDPAKFPKNFMASYELSGGDVAEALAPGDELYVIWPENAAYDYFQRDQSALNLLQELLPAKAVLITGAIRVEEEDATQSKFYNSIHVVADIQVPDAAERAMLAELMESPNRRLIVSSYDKHHLAPFGEYVPFSGLFEALGIDRVVPLNNGLSRGDGPAVLNLGRTRVAPIICYETIFPGRMYPYGQRPDWMVTVTNDAWFGDSVGPKQHLAQAKLRAIENGLAMVRSANTGISAVIDPYGRLLESLPLLEKGRIESGLPAPAPMPVYARVGDLLYFLMMIFIVGVYSYLHYYRKSRVN